MHPDYEPTPDHRDRIPTSASPQAVRNELSRNQSGHYRLSLTITTTSSEAYAYAHDQLVNLIASTLFTDHDAVVELEQANTTTAHYDNQPF